MATETITYSENSEGWTSFHSWKPDWMAKLNNRFFSIKDGQLWMHNDETNSVRNNFYGVQYPSIVKTVINEANSEDKIFKTLVLEGNAAWDATLETNLASSTISDTEFHPRESRWFAHTRQNESTTDLHGLAVQGLGDIVSSTGLTVTFANAPQMVNIGDELYQSSLGVEQLIGTIVSIAGGVVTVNAITTAAVNGLFAYAKKPARTDGSALRGYYALVTLQNDKTSYVELFAVSSNIIRSGVNIQNNR